MKNKYRFLLLSLFLLLIARVPKSCAQWEQTNGPYGGVINSVACAGNVMFAGTNSGLFRSTDKGVSWTHVAIVPGDEPQNVYALRTEGGVIFAGTNSGMFVSSDSGHTWKQFNVYLPSGLALVTGIAVYDSLMAYDSGPVEVVHLTNGLQSSGVPIGSLLIVNNSTTADTVIQAFDIDSTSVLVGTNYGVYVSKDSGRTWSKSDSGLAQLDVTALRIDGNTVVAGTDSGVFLSTDDGASWHESGGGLVGMSVRTIAVNGANFFVCTNGGGIFTSTDNGSSWTSMNSGLTNPYVNTIAFYGNTPFVGTDGNGVFSFDGEWTPVNDGLNATTIDGLASAGTDVLAATYGGGIFLSTDNGASWTTSNSGLTNLYVHSIVSFGSDLFAATQGSGIFKSTDDGRDWFSSNTDIKQKFVNCLFADSSEILAGTILPPDAPEYLAPADSDWADSGMVYRSKNDGLSWSALNTRLFTVRAVVAVGSTIIASGLIYTVRSTDDGSTWAPINMGATCQSFGIQGSTIIGGTVKGGVYLSTDAGTSWSKASVSTLFTGQVNVPAVGDVGNSVIVSLQMDTSPHIADVFRSDRDTLSKWTQLDSGLVDAFLPPPTSVPVVSAFTTSNGLLFAGTKGSGVWKLPLSQATGGEAVEPPLPSYFTLSQNYPNPFNPSTVIEFEVRSSAFVSLRVYDVLGRLVRTLVNKIERPGSYKVELNAADLPSGVYFYRMRAGRYSKTMKLIVLK